MLIFVIGMLASMIFGACVMFAVMDIYLLERKVRKLKNIIARMKEAEPEIVKVIDITEEATNNE